MSVAPAPDGIISLAASSLDTETVYAATQQGLLVSRDGGSTWESAHPSRQPATMVKVTGDGAVYVFILGAGLAVAREGGLQWEVLSDDFGADGRIHLAVDPQESRSVYAIVLDPRDHGQAVLASGDSGRTWTRLGEQ